MSNVTIRTDENRTAVLATLAAGGSLTLAAQAAGMARDALWRWRTDEPEFAKACKDAEESGTDRLEDEAMRRALEQSDTMMIFMLKARRPDKYRERSTVETTGPGGGPVLTQTTHKLDLGKLSDDEMARLQHLTEKASADDPA
jgi:hypothetical protein